MENMKKTLQVVTDTLGACLKCFEFMKRMFWNEWDKHLISMFCEIFRPSLHVLETLQRK